MSESSLAWAGNDGTQRRLIGRQRLFRQLERDWPSPLTVVTAPAGFGKTTAIESWLIQRKERIVWVALDEDHNDPVLLWSSLLAEAAQAHGVGASARIALESTLGSPRAAIELFAGELRGAEARFVFVLDDVHLISDPACIQTIELFTRLMAGNASVVLITRQEPALPLERLYGRGQLLSVGPEELAFDLEETRDLLARYEVNLDREALETVYAVTGGWPAAVYMSALWLRDVPDQSSMAHEISRPQEELTEYLLSEVIDGLDPEMRTFLRRSAVPLRISGPLCDRILRQKGSAEMIERLRDTNLLVKSDRRHPGWYRYHALLRVVLLQELRDEEPAVVIKLHRAAAEWFLQNEMPEDAAEQAREGGDFELLADLLMRFHLALLRTGRSATLLRWVDSIPEGVFDSRPDAAVAAAMVAENAARPSSEIRKLLARAATGHRGHPAWTAENEVAWQILTAGAGEEGIAVSVKAAERAVAISESVPQLHHVSRSVLSMFLELAGEPDAAYIAANSVIEDPGIDARPFAHLLTRGTLALVELERGGSRNARRHVREANEVIARAGIEEGPIAARIYSCEALVCLAEGEIAGAAQAVERSLQHPFDTSPLLAWALLVAAEVRARAGDFRAGREALSHAGELLRASPDPGRRLPVLMEQVIARAVASEADGAGMIKEVSPAELRVLRLLAEGLTRAEVAASLVVSVNTVKTHQRSLYRKLGASERETVVGRARAHGLLD